MSKSKQRTLVTLLCVVLALITAAGVLSVAFVQSGISAPQLPVGGAVATTAVSAMQTEAGFNGVVTDEMIAVSKAASDCEVTTQDDIRSFFKGEGTYAGKSYAIFSESARANGIEISTAMPLQNQQDVDNSGKTLDGAGGAITFTFLDKDTSWTTRWVNVNYGCFNNHVQQGGLIHVNRGTIQNINFLLDSGDEWARDQEHGVGITMGYVCGSNVGTIDNCSLTIKRGVGYFFQASKDGSGNVHGSSLEFGGYCGSNVGTISNSKLDLQEGSYIRGKCKGYKGAFNAGWGPLRCYVGGFAGSMAAGSKISNITLTGSGAVEALNEKPYRDAAYGFGGGIAGINTGDSTASNGQTNQNMGYVTGVITDWTGRAVGRGLGGSYNGIYNQSDGLAYGDMESYIMTDGSGLFGNFGASGSNFKLADKILFINHPNMDSVLANNSGAPGTLCAWYVPNSISPQFGSIDTVAETGAYGAFTVGFQSNDAAGSYPVVKFDVDASKPNDLIYGYDLIDSKNIVTGRSDPQYYQTITSAEQIAKLKSMQTDPDWFIGAYGNLETSFRITLNVRTAKAVYYGAPKYKDDGIDKAYGKSNADSDVYDLTAEGIAISKQYDGRGLSTIFLPLYENKELSGTPYEVNTTQTLAMWGYGANAADIGKYTDDECYTAGTWHRRVAYKNEGGKIDENVALNVVLDNNRYVSYASDNQSYTVKQTIEQAPVNVAAVPKSADELIYAGTGIPIVFQPAQADLITPVATGRLDTVTVEVEYYENGASSPMQGLPVHVGDYHAAAKQLAGKDAGNYYIANAGDASAWDFAITQRTVELVFRNGTAADDPTIKSFVYNSAVQKPVMAAEGTPSADTADVIIKGMAQTDSDVIVQQEGDQVEGSYDNSFTGVGTYCLNYSLNTSDIYAQRDYKLAEGTTTRQYYTITPATAVFTDGEGTDTSANIEFTYAGRNYRVGAYSAVETPDVVVDLMGVNNVKLAYSTVYVLDGKSQRSIRNAGTYEVTLSLDDELIKRNYVVEDKVFNVVIKPIEATLNFDASLTDSVVYDRTAKDYSKAQLDGILESDTYTNYISGYRYLDDQGNVIAKQTYDRVEQTLTLSEGALPVNAGKYTVEAILEISGRTVGEDGQVSESGNYSVVSATTMAFEITRLDVSVAPLGYTREYGIANEEAVTVVGDVAYKFGSGRLVDVMTYLAGSNTIFEEDADQVIVQSAQSDADQWNSKVGVYAITDITFGGSAAGNYNIVVEPEQCADKMEVTVRVIDYNFEVQGAEQSGDKFVKIYDGQPLGVTATETSELRNFVCAIVMTKVGDDLTHLTPEQVVNRGNYVVSAELSKEATENGIVPADNYKFSGDYKRQIRLEIVAREITINVDDAQSVYGDEYPEVAQSHWRIDQASLGFVDSDLLNPVLYISSGEECNRLAALANVGVYALKLAHEDAEGNLTPIETMNDNYRIVYGTEGSLQITERPLTLEFVKEIADRITYGDAVPVYDAAEDAVWKYADGSLRAVEGDLAFGVTTTYTLYADALTDYAVSVGVTDAVANSGKLANYTITYPQAGSLSVDPLTVYPELTLADADYDGKDKTPSIAYYKDRELTTPLDEADPNRGISADIVYTREGSSASVSVNNAGNYTATFTLGEEDKNYRLGADTVQFNIAKRQVRIGLGRTNQEGIIVEQGFTRLVVPYATVLEDEYRLTAVVLNDNPFVEEGVTLSWQTTYDPTCDVSKNANDYYPVVIQINGEYNASNYAVEYTNARIYVTQRELTPHYTVAGGEYNGTAYDAVVTFDNLPAGMETFEGYRLMYVHNSGGSVFAHAIGAGVWKAAIICEDDNFTIADTDPLTRTFEITKRKVTFELTIPENYSLKRGFGSYDISVFEKQGEEEVKVENPWAIPFWKMTEGSLAAIDENLIRIALGFTAENDPANDVDNPIITEAFKNGVSVQLENSLIVAFDGQYADSYEIVTTNPAAVTVIFSDITKIVLNADRFEYDGTIVTAGFEQGDRLNFNGGFIQHFNHKIYQITADGEKGAEVTDPVAVGKYVLECTLKEEYVGYYYDTDHNQVGGGYALAPLYFEITPCVLDITIGSVGAIYGNDADLTQEGTWKFAYGDATVEQAKAALMAKDDVTIALNTAYRAGDRTGSYDITASAVYGDSSKEGFFTLNVVSSGKVVVSPASITFDIEGLENTEYDATVKTLRAVNVRNSDGEEVSVTISFIFRKSVDGVMTQMDALHAGTYEVTAVADDSNYMIDESQNATFMWTIAPRRIGLSFDAFEESVTYRGSEGYQVGGITFENLAENETDAPVYEISYLRDDQPTANMSAVGVYKFEITMNAHNDYVLTAPAQGTLTIVKAAVDVTVSAPQGLIYDGTSKEAALSYGERKPFDGDQPQIVVTYDMKQAVHAGTYEIEVSMSENDSYVLGTVTGDTQLTIAPKAVTAVIPDTSVVYNGNAVNAPQIALEGVIGEDRVTVTAAFGEGQNLIDVGEYDYSVTISGNDDYVLTGITSGKVVVKPAPQTLSADDVKLSIHYNKIVVTDRNGVKLDNAQYRLDNGNWTDDNELAVSALGDYKVYVRLKASDNYTMSEAVSVTAQTGCDVAALNAKIKNFGEMDFSKLDAWDRIKSERETVGADDESAFDQTAYEKLDRAYLNLIDAAQQVIRDAQSIGAKASGQSAQSAAAAGVAAVSLLGIAAVIAKKKFLL